MTSSPSKIPDLNNISQSTSVQERGLVHRARNREDEGSILWISSWFRLLSVHLAWETRENGSRGGSDDVRFHSCTWSKTVGCFLQAISYLFLQTVPSISPSAQSTLSKQGYTSYHAFMLIISIGYDAYEASKYYC